MHRHCDIRGARAPAYPRTKHGLTQCYRNGGTPHYFTEFLI
jgi:hypothetical protein